LEEFKYNFDPIENTFPVIQRVASHVTYRAKPVM